MAAKNEDLNDLLQCSICMEAFQVSGRMKPKMLPCQHSFCQRCLSSMSTGMRIQCPVCRRNHANAIDELPFNLLLLQIIEQKGPVAPDPDEEARKQASDHIDNLRKLYKSPAEAKKYVKLYKELQLSIDFDPEHLSVLLKCMEYYEQVGDAKHLEIITDVMQIAYNLLRKAGSSFYVYARLKDRLVKGVVAVMNSFKRREMVQKHGVSIFTQLPDPKLLGDHVFDVSKVIFQSLSVLTEESFEYIIVVMIAIHASKVSREDNAVLGSAVNVKNLLRILGLKLYSKSYKPTFETILAAFMSLTDETPTSSINIMKEKGLDIFEKLLQDSSITLDVKGSALIVVSNFAEVPEVQKEMIRHRSLVGSLRNLMMSNNRWVSFMSASSIAHLSLISKREWTQLCGVSGFRDDVLQKLYARVSSWEMTIPTQNVYRTFEPFYRLLRRYDSPPAQLFAAWSIRHFCHIDRNTYREMLIREGAVDILTDIKDNNYADANVRKIVSDILVSIR